MNEVNALLKRCFEALGYLPGDYTDAATAGVWLESHGLPGVSRIATHLSDLKLLATRRLEITARADGTATLQANGVSTLTCGQKIADLAGAMTYDSQIVRLEVLQCSDPNSIVPAIAAIGRWQYSAIAYWQTPESMFCCHLLQPDDLPRIERWSAPSVSPLELETLHLIASQSADELEAALDNLRDTFGSAEQVTEAESMRQFYDDQLEHGLIVDAGQWEQLYAVANGVLVDATEQSRRGAGA